jgi:hypothetical protein
LHLQHTTEAALPRRNRRSNVPEDEVIPLVPNTSNHHSQAIHEEIVSKSTLSSLNHREEIHIMIQLDSHVIPAF